MSLRSGWRAAPTQARAHARRHPRALPVAAQGARARARARAPELRAFPHENRNKRRGAAPPPQALPKKGDGDGSAAAAIDDATLALLEELNAPDMRLYEYATTLMYHRIATAAQVGRWGVGLVRRASAKRRTNDERTKGRRDEGTNERMDQWTNERME